MAQIPTTESDVQKVIRIAGELGIGLEDAAVTCDAFHLAFSDDRMRRAIFGMIDELDDEAAKKGEPLVLIINYTVELDLEGIRVGRYADEIPAGEIADLCPPHRARILLKIKDNFPTQQFLGPLIVNRPDLMSEPRPQGAGSISDINELPSLAEEGWQTDVFCRADGLVRSDTDTTQREIPTELPSHWPVIPICLGPIRLKFNERFPCVLVTKSSSQRAVLPAGMPTFHSKALDPPRHLPPWAALPAGMPAFQSGLSPPFHSENLGHSKSERCSNRPPATLRVETCVSHLDL